MEHGAKALWEISYNPSSGSQPPIRRADSSVPSRAAGCLGALFHVSLEFHVWRSYGLTCIWKLRVVRGASSPQVPRFENGHGGTPFCREEQWGPTGDTLFGGAHARAIPPTGAVEQPGLSRTGRSLQSARARRSAPFVLNTGLVPEEMVRFGQL